MNDDLRCRWMGSDNPRAIIGRHDDDCQREECRGCEPCRRAHCRVCGIEHAAGACAECVGTVREDLDTLAELCADLPAEVQHRGVNGEAFNLLGPVADAEAWGHRKASVLSGRIVPMDCDAHDLDDVRAWLEKADHERHPLWIVTTWAMAYRDAFEHDEPTTAVNLGSEVGYLARNLTYAAAFEDVPFEDFARDLRACLDHVRTVLHDENRGEFANVNCFDCGGALERRLNDKGFDDSWTCRGCRRRYSISDYNLALRAKLEESA